MRHLRAVGLASVGSAAALSLILTACSHASPGALAPVGAGHLGGARPLASTSHSYSIDLALKPFGNNPSVDWPLAKLNVDLEELGERGTAGWSDPDGPTIRADGGPATAKYSDVSYIATPGPGVFPDLYDDIWNDAPAHVESDFQHIVLDGSNQCGTSFTNRVVHKGVYYNPNVSQTKVATVYNSDVMQDAHDFGDSAVFYDGTADWRSLNGDGKPCNPATGTDWVHYDFAHQLVGTFLNSETALWNIPFFVNGNAEVQFSPLQAADTVRAMKGINILGVKIEATNQIDETNTWQSFEDDALVGALNGWKTVWEYGAGLNGTSSTDLQVRMEGIASVLLTYYDGAGVWWSFDTHAPPGSGFAVMPEAQIVPTDPVQAEPAPAPDGTGNAISALARGGGYGREFRHCFVGGVDKGVCAVFVTLKNQTGTWPFSAIYGHTLVLHLGPNGGADIAAGGYVTLDGPLPTGPIPHSTGIIAFQ